MVSKSGKIGDIQETLKDYNIEIKDITGNDILSAVFQKRQQKYQITGIHLI